MLLPATLHPRRSRVLVVAVLAAHLVAALGLLLVAPGWALKAAGCAVLVASSAFALRRPDIGTLTLRVDGRIEIGRHDGSVAEASVEPATTVVSWLVVLVYRIGGRIEALVLPPDTLTDDAHRELRLWLRWKAASD